MTFASPAPLARAASPAKLFEDFRRGVLPDRWSYTGNGGTGTRVNSVGTMVASVADTARFDYDPVTLTPLGVLVEPAATNLILRSSEYDNASWAKTNATVSANAVTGPDGASSADTLTDNTTSGGHLAIQSFTPLASTTYTFSLYAKKGIKRYGALAFTGAGIVTPIHVTTDFDTSGAVATANGSPVAIGVDQAGGGFFRPWVAGTTVSTASMTPGFYGMNGSAYANRSYSGGTESVGTLFGTQLEVGSSPSTYIPTAGASVTRTADALVRSNLRPGSYRLHFADGTTLDLAHGGGDYTVPNAALRRLMFFRAI